MMNKIILILFIFFSSNNANAQLHDKFPFNEKGEIVYSEVVNIKGADKTDLYRKATIFFADDMLSTGNIVQLDDKENGIIIGKGFLTIPIQNKKMSIPVNLHFTIKVEARDDRYRYEVYSLRYETKATSFTAEELFAKEKSAEYKKAKKNARDIADQYLDRTVTVVDNIVSTLKEYMSSNSNKKDW